MRIPANVARVICESLGVAYREDFPTWFVQQVLRSENIVVMTPHRKALLAAERPEPEKPRGHVSAEETAKEIARSYAGYRTRKECAAMFPVSMLCKRCGHRFYDDPVALKGSTEYKRPITCPWCLESYFEEHRRETN